MTNASPTIAELKHTGRRRAEDLVGLRRTEAQYQSEAARFDAEIADLTESLAHATAGTWRDVIDGTYQIKRRIVELERDRDTVRHEGCLLEPQIAETETLIEDNKAAIEALEAKARS
jgi:chromosome segregation ATPase